MKTNLIAIALVVFACFMSCSEDESHDLVVSPSSVSIASGEEIKLSASENCDWRSESDFIATVDDDGIVKANFVGQTNIIAYNVTKSTSVPVVVRGKCNTYTEPVLDFGTTMADIKSKEQRTLISETGNYLRYAGENSAVKDVVYMFDNGRMSSAGVLINGLYMTELVDFITERYKFVSETDGLYVFCNGFSVSEATVGVGVGVSNNDDILVSYMQITNITKASCEETEAEAMLRHELIKRASLVCSVK